MKKIKDFTLSITKQLSLEDRWHLLIVCRFVIDGVEYSEGFWITQAEFEAMPFDTIRQHRRGEST